MRRTILPSIAVCLIALPALALDPGLRHKKPKKGFEPVAFQSVIDGVVAKHPNAGAFTLNVRRTGAFEFTTDGRASFGSSSSTSGLVTDSALASNGGDATLACIAPRGSWSGICIRTYRNAAGEMFCTGVFGNRAKWRNKCSVSVP